MIAVDTNILVYAHREEFPRHEQARAALLSLTSSHAPWGVPVFAVCEFLRVVTDPRYLDEPDPPAVAMRAITRLLESSRARVVVPGDRFVRVLADVVDDSRASGAMVYDAQIVAVCIEHGIGTLLTEDRGLRQFHGVTVQTLDDAR